MRHYNKIIATALIIGSIATGVKAQDNQLDPVTVTATLRPVSSSATGRNIVVIKGDQFAKLPVNSLDELLKYLPGLEVQARGPMGSQSDIVLRGSTFQQVLVLIDGVRINDANTGHFSSYIPIAPTEIDRIEILKGAASAIYGTEAVGGVINIVTKTFAFEKERVSKEVSAQAIAGEYKLLSGRAGANISNGKTAISAGVISNNAKGQQQRGTQGYLYNTTGSGSISHFINPNLNVAVRGAFDRRDFAAQNFYTTFLSDTAREKVTSYWAQARVAYSKNNNSIALDLGYKDVKDEYVYNGISTANLNKSQLLQATATYSRDFGTNTSATTGVQYINKAIKSNDRGNHNLYQAAYFLLLNHRAGDHLLLSPALRAQYTQVSGWEFVPQLNASYKLPNAQLRISAGKSIRDADFTERYNNYNKGLVTGGRIGNPNLKQERSYNYEAGADYYGVKSLKVSATFFQQYFQRLIDYVPTKYLLMPRKDNLAPNGSYALARNISNVVNSGVEVDLQYNKQLNKDHHITANAGVTCIATENKGAPSFYISSHANFLTNVTLQYNYKKVMISVTGIYKDRDPQMATAISAETKRDYTLVNLLGQWSISEKIAVYGQVDNVLDKKYSDLLGAIMPRRWAMGGLKVSL